MSIGSTTESPPAPRNGHQALDELRRTVAGRVYVPGDPGWERARTPWAVAVKQTPLAVVEVVDAEDVRSAVRWAVENDRQVTAQPVGHGANGPIDQVLLLRTRALNSISIDLAASTVIVGAGVKVGELLQALKDTGLTFLAGSNPDPTVIGMTISGGMSWFGRAHGVAANSIVSADLVDGLGRVRRVTREEDPDLFWALRGGGGDFGIITSLELKLVPAHDLYGGKLLWPAEQMPAVLRAFRQITETAPDDLTLWFYGYRFPPHPELPEPIRGKAFAGVAATYLGPAVEAERLLEPLRAVPGIVMGTLGRVPMHELARVADEPTEPMPTREHSMLLDDVSDEVVDRLTDVAGAASASPLMILKILHLGGRFRADEPGNGAGGHIDEPYLLFAMGVLVEAGAGDALASAFARLDLAVAGHTNGRTVPNFLNSGGDIDRIWAPEVRRRLARIKHAVDPMSTIRSNRPVLDGGGQR